MLQIRQNEGQHCVRLAGNFGKARIGLSLEANTGEKAVEVGFFAGCPWLKEGAVCSSTDVERRA